MNTSVMKTGLPEINISKIESDNTIVVTASVVDEACDNLNRYADSLNQYVLEVENQKEEILRDWEGVAAERFRAEFPKMIEALQAVPGTIRSISDWTMSTKNGFVKIDQCTADAISSKM